MSENETHSADPKDTAGSPDDAAVSQNDATAPTPFDAAPSDESSDESASTAPAQDSATPPRASRSGRARIAAFTAAGVLLLTIGAGGGALAADALRGTTNPPTATGDSTSGGSSSTFSGPGAFGPRNGFGGGNGAGGDDSTSSTATAATAAQTAGVVTITTKLGYQSSSAAGTGIVLTASGEILTNNHVVSGATSISVTDETTDTTYTAVVVGTDATDDIAVLQLKDATGLQTATLSTTAASIGDTVTAVGNAGGTGSLTTATGSVTALNQQITTQAEGSAASENLDGLIETDADVVAGDSGGPLTNSTGTVVGIDTAASSGTRQVQSYAIPIADALDIVRQIRTGTETSTITIGYPAFLGIQVDSTETGEGAAIAGTLEGTPAATAGLVDGDTITAVDGHTITSGDDLTNTLRNYNAGDAVTVTYNDAQGATHSSQITLIQGPAD